MDIFWLKIKLSYASLYHQRMLSVIFHILHSSLFKARDSLCSHRSPSWATLTKDSVSICHTCLYVYGWPARTLPVSMYGWLLDMQNNHHGFLTHVHPSPKDKRTIWHKRMTVDVWTQGDITCHLRYRRVDFKSHVIFTVKAVNFF